eukprot:3414560-Rhodomonas_salina.1
MKPPLKGNDTHPYNPVTLLHPKHRVDMLGGEQQQQQAQCLHYILLNSATILRSNPKLFQWAMSDPKRVGQTHIQERMAGNQYHQSDFLFLQIQLLESHPRSDGWSAIVWCRPQLESMLLSCSRVSASLDAESVWIEVAREGREWELVLDLQAQPWLTFDMFMLKDEWNGKVIKEMKRLGRKTTSVLTQLFARHCTNSKEANLQAGHPKLFFDLGCNYGFYMLLALKSGCDIICVEPNPVLALLVVRSARLNDFTCSLVVVQAAAGDSASVQELHTVTVHLGVSLLVG